MPNKEKLISLIIPVYNVEEYLSDCLESIISQSYENLEVLCINDVSTDKSLAILEKYQRKDKRITVLNNQTNKGPSFSRNVGLKTARGEYFTFIDSDDILHPDYCKVLAHAIQGNDISIGYLFYFSDKKKISSSKINLNKVKQFALTKDPIEDVVFNRIPIQITPKLYRKSVIDVEFVEENNKAEDWLYILEAVTKTNKVVMVDQYLYYYRIREKSLSNFKKKDFLKGLRPCIKPEDMDPAKKKLSFWVFSQFISILKRTAKYEKNSITYEYIFEKYISKKIYDKYDEVESEEKNCFILVALSTGNISNYLLTGLVVPKIFLNNKSFSRLCFFYVKQNIICYPFRPIVITFIFLLKAILKINRTVKAKLNPN